MKIHDLEFHLVSIGQTDSAAPIQSLLARITTNQGVEGWGESGLAWRPAELAARRESLLAVLEGRSIYDLEELHTLDALNPPPLRAAVEMAVWDALGRSLRLPLYNLLGGYYRRRIPLTVRIAGHRSVVTASIARERADQGFHTQTIAASGRVEEDLRGLAAVRQLVGDRVELRLDGLARYDLDAARQLADGAEAFGLQFLLDPLRTDDLRLVASLGRQTSVPLAVGRTIGGPADAVAAVRCNAAPFLVVDLDQVGGVVPARACAIVAAAAGVVPVLGGRPSVGIATSALLHVAAATAAFSAANEFASGQPRDTVLREPLEIVDGMALLPPSFGLGVTVDRAKVERYQVA